MKCPCGCGAQKGSCNEIQEIDSEETSSEWVALVRWVKGKYKGYDDEPFEVQASSEEEARRKVMNDVERSYPQSWSAKIVMIKPGRISDLVEENKMSNKNLLETMPDEQRVDADLVANDIIDVVEDEFLNLWEPITDKMINIILKHLPRMEQRYGVKLPRDHKVLKAMLEDAKFEEDFDYEISMEVISLMQLYTKHLVKGLIEQSAVADDMNS